MGDLGSLAGDEPVARAYFDSAAGYVVLETVRRFPRGGRIEPLGMGRRRAEHRDPWSSEAAPPEGTITVGSLMESIASCGASDAVVVRMFEGDDPEVTDVGIISVGEFPLQGDAIWTTEDGSLRDSYGNPVPEGEDRVVYVVITLGEDFSSEG